MSYLIIVPCAILSSIKNISVRFLDNLTCFNRVCMIFFDFQADYSRIIHGLKLVLLILILGGKSLI